MNCPACSRDVPPGATCPYCGARLSARLPEEASGPAGAIERVPLTAGQRARLLWDCIPVVFFMLALVFVQTLLDRIVASHSPLLPLFLAFVILVTGYEALQRVRDLAAGAAQVRRDRLERMWRTSGSGRHRYGKFASLGRLRLTRQAFDQARPGSQHRITYSPASKIAWEAQPDESYDQIRSQAR